MENKTIQEILQKKLIRGSFVEGGFLYSPLFGKCTLKSANKDLFLERRNPFRPSVADTLGLRPDGKFSDDGECMVYPSPGMRDWNKFAWEEYTLLKSSNGKPFVFFECWEGKDYTKFKGISFRTKGGELRRVVKKYDTSKFVEVDEESARAFYVTLFFAVKHSIPELEEMVPLYRSVVFEIHKQSFNRALDEFEALGKKSTREEKNNEGRTIQKKFPEKFELHVSDEDFSEKTFENFLVVPNYLLENVIFRFDDKNSNDYYYIARLNRVSGDERVVSFKEIVRVTSFSGRSYFHRNTKIGVVNCVNVRLANKDEVGHLALISNAAKWSSDKKYHNAPLPFKPKDWVLMRNSNEELWDLCIFAYDMSEDAEEDVFVAIGGVTYSQCIPYEGNEQLLGTAKSLDDGK